MTRPICSYPEISQYKELAIRTTLPVLCAQLRRDETAEKRSIASFSLLP
jgi:hypothetical protein